MQAERRNELSGRLVYPGKVVVMVMLSAQLSGWGRRRRALSALAPADFQWPAPRADWG